MPPAAAAATVAGCIAVSPAGYGLRHPALVEIEARIAYANADGA
jgi:hypothetical protein